MITEKIELLKITPDEGKYLKNIHTNEVYEDYVFPAISLTEKDFADITAEEYQAIKETEMEEEIEKKLGEEYE
jgi:hypothetical protein